MCGCTAPQNLALPQLSCSGTGASGGVKHPLAEEIQLRATIALPLSRCLFGVIKVEERPSFADAFALALAERLNIPLVTTDHHEFDAIERKGHFRFLWLR
jgi:hypothetical protein